MDASSAATPVNPARRSVVAAAGAAGLASALAACGGSGKTSGSATPSQGGGDTSQQASQPSSGSDGGTGSGTGSGGGAQLAKTSDIPKGGGQVFADQKVVVTQPSAGQFKGFSAVCPHQGCTVSEVKDGTINCPCHGSKFHIADGSVATGPATQPLAPAKITVEGGSVKMT